MAEKLVAVVNPDGTLVGSGAPVGTQNVAVVNTPTVTANAGTGTFTVGGTVNTISVPNPLTSTIYGYSASDLPGVVASNVFVSYMNPVGSGKTVYVVQANVSRYSIAGSNSANSMRTARITGSTGGTLIAASGISKWDTAGADTVVEVRTGNPTVTGIGATVALFAPPVGTNSNPQVDALVGNPAGPFVLHPGEGLIYQTTAGDVDQRWNLSSYWIEA